MSSSSEKSWSEFLSLFADIDACNGISSQLQWDQDLFLPSGAGEQRGRQIGWLEAHAHRLTASDRYHDTLQALTGDASLADDRRAAARYHLKLSKMARKVPESLVTALAAKRAEALPAWKDAKTKSDWKTFAPILRELLGLQREYADLIREPNETAYDAMVGLYDQGVSAKEVGALLESLRGDLVPLARGWIERHRSRPKSKVDWSMPIERQHTVSRLALEWMGFDFGRGRIDVSVHPFCSGSGADTRLTTRYVESDWTDSLYSVLHEGGHGLYEQGLERLVKHRPLRSAAGMAMHESQSRFWENCVGRSRAFCEITVTGLRTAGLIDGAISADDLFAYLNGVDASLIRVASDEATYNLHILLRYEMESAMVSGDLSIDDVPGAWNEKMERYLGIRPANDAEGCLQDIHWSFGSFGYFPSYAVGNLIAAQLLAAVRAEFDVDACVRARELPRLRDWLGERVHAHGCRWSTLELVEKATGSKLSHRPFIDYLSAKLG